MQLTCVLTQVGGMGDVVTALGRAVQEEGHKVEVILPKYDCIRYDDVSPLRPLHAYLLLYCHEHGPTLHNLCHNAIRKEH